MKEGLFMGNYSVPDSIRKFKPKGTMVKVIHGNYYVYEYSCQKNENGEWRTKMGSLIGSIQEGIGFIPNDSLNKKQNDTTLEYGQYALSYANSKNTLNMLLDFFNPIDAHQIYFIALLHFVNGFSPLKNIESYFEQSYFCAVYPDLKMSYHVISNLLDSLGRKQDNVINFEQKLLADSSKEIALDGHVIRSCSHENDLAEKGNKYNLIKDSQINVLMAYDINTNKPLLSRIYEGGCLDKISIKDITSRFEFTDTLFIVDRGFYSTQNIELFSMNQNTYIIPLSPNLVTYKTVVQDMNLNKVFIYERNRKRSAIEYREILSEDGKSKIIIYRDVNQSALDQADYLKNMENGKGNYTEENYIKVKDFFGVIVLQTNCIDKSAQEIFELYKKRWKIETYYNYIKNGVNISALHLDSYYMTQGLSFIMLIVGLIHSEFNKAMNISKITGKTVDDVLLEGRFIKIHRNRGHWAIENMKKSRQDMMVNMNVNFDEIDEIK